METRPTLEQLRFFSAKTGEHNLDTYMEAVERGNRTLPDLLSDLFDPTTGAFRSGLYQFRFTGAILQYRVGDFADPNAGWISIPGTEVLGDLPAITAATAAAEAARDTAASSSSSAGSSATSASGSASAAATSASDAAASAASAAASFDSFDDRYLGAKATNPTLDNDSNPLLTGAIYFNTTLNEMRVYNGSAWVVTYNPSSSGVSTFNGRAGAVVPAANDYAISQVTGLQAALDAKANTSHTHPAAQISDSTSAGRTLLMAADATAQRTALGLGTAATQASTAFAPTSHTHTVAQISDASASGRSLISAADYAAMRSLLGLSIGTNIQAQDAELSALAALASSADQMPYFTGPGAAALTPLPAFGRSLISQSAAANARSTLGLTNVSTWSEATISQYLTSTASAAISPSAMWGAAAIATIADGASPTIDLAAATNFSWTLAGNRTMPTFSNALPGAAGLIRVIQDATGGRTLAYHSNFKFGGGIPTIASAANASTVFAYFVFSATWIYMTANPGVG